MGAQRNFHPLRLKSEGRAQMARKKGKPISFDGMVKFFMQYHNIPTKKDIDRLSEQMNRIEQMLKALSTVSSLQAPSRAKSKKSRSTASDIVLDIIKQDNQGVGIEQIQAKSGFETKKLRNIVYHLNKTGKIRRKNRGVYVA